MAAQGWNDCAAPVLWTERCHDGIVYRQEVFAHIPGGQVARRGDEPLFAWIRLSVADTIEALPLEDETAFDVRIQGTHLTCTMIMRNNIRIHAERRWLARIMQ